MLMRWEYSCIYIYTELRWIHCGELQVQELKCSILWHNIKEKVVLCIYRWQQSNRWIAACLCGHRIDYYNNKREIWRRKIYKIRTGKNCQKGWEAEMQAGSSSKAPPATSRAAACQEFTATQVISIYSASTEYKPTNSFPFLHCSNAVYTSVICNLRAEGLNIEMKTVEMIKICVQQINNYQYT